MLTAPRRFTGHGVLSTLACVHLHDDTLGTAAGLSLAFAHLHFVGGAAAATVAAAACRVALHLAVETSDLSDDIVEGLINVDARLGRRLNELAAEVLCQGLALWIGGQRSDPNVPRQGGGKIPCLDTSRSPSRSHLLPTTTMGK